MMEGGHDEGTGTQVMGDGIMARFGLPIGHEDHALRACYAALRVQRQVTLYADEIQRADGTPVPIPVGLSPRGRAHRMPIQGAQIVWFSVAVALGRTPPDWLRHRRIGPATLGRA